MVGFAPALLLTLATTVPAIDIASPVFDTGVCEDLIARHPDDARAFDCYQRYVHWTLDQATAVERMEAYLADHPAHPPAQLTLARFLIFSDHARSRELATAAREAFREHGDVVGEARATALLITLAAVKQRFDDADALGREALTLVDRADDLETLANVQTERARLALNRGDAGEAWLIVRELETDLRFDAIPPMPKLFYYAFAKIAASRVDRDADASRFARDMLTLAETVGSRRHACGAATHMLSAATARVDRGEILRADARPALDRARAACEPFTGVVAEVEFRLLAAQLLPHREAMNELSIVERKSRESPFCRHLTTVAMTRMGTSILEHEPDRADEALALIREGVREGEHSDAYRRLSSLLYLVRAQIAVASRDEALAAALAALDAIEALSDRQTGAEPPARLIAQFAPTYYTVIDFLLSPPDRDASQDEVRLAFGVSERLRARRLLTHLRAAEGATDRDQAMAVETEAAIVARRETLDHIARTRLELVVEQLDPAERARKESLVESLYLDEQRQRGGLERLRRRLVSGSESRDEDQDVLARTAAGLDARTAILSFIVPEDRNVPARLFVRTHDALRTYNLGAAGRLSDATRLVAAALARRDGSAASGLTRLHDDLLTAARADLPDTVDRFVVLPDGPVHGVPFDALTPTVGTAPLVERIDVQVAPSARTWLHLLELEYPGGRRALVFADPRRNHAGAASAVRAVELGPLPHSRDEGRFAFAALGRRGELYTGRAAAKVRLTGEPALPFDVVHFATHAVVDGDRPERSAVVLAADRRTDGRLTVPEIMHLQMPGALVVLSTCSSASGETLRGEGVISLARAFFMAGASTVVGSLWPVQDRETHELMQPFYEGLAAGMAPGAALAAAKRERLRAGAHAAAWSGFVVLGAASRPLPPAPKESPVRTGWVLVALAGALAAAWWFVRRR